ncbi:MAG: NAD(P)/FAD-dependent oxidoreductase [Actinobacteria bacterium]|nr:NAD(P)/FAD-dependent oxidoreductase [Actinomycetota bacterium]
MERFDVLVVGAGPAGSSTAIHLARAGARVLLAEKAAFPRDKPCGGGLTGRALKRIPVDPSPVVERDVDRFELRLRYGARFTRGHDEPLIRMTQRSRLDAFLAEAAAVAGAELRQRARVDELRPDERGVLARVGGVPVRADVLVGADGANGVVARSVGLGDGIVHGVALEGNVPLDVLDGDWERTATIELATVPGGYGWVFPKGDHANLGVGGWGSEGPRLREHLTRLAREHRVDAGELTDVRGHRLPMRRLGTLPGEGRVLLVGDAAGLVDPLSGDGMYEAFVSARLAAEAILVGDLNGYSAALAGVLDRHAAASWAAKRALDRYPRTVFAAARAPGVFGVVAGLLCGEVAHPGDARGVARGPLKLIARLAR